MRWMMLWLLWLCCSCASSSPDWSSLATGADPEFRAGPCGPELKFQQTISATSKVEIVGTVTIKPVCPSTE